MLHAVHPSLASIFDRWFGLAALAAQKTVPGVYQRLFKQPAAEESILQMMNQPALADLVQFNTSPTKANLSSLIAIPTVYDVLRYEFITGAVASTDTLEMCRWLRARCEEVPPNLPSKNKVTLKGCLVDNTESVSEKSWKLYAMPQIRYRPSYPLLKHDQHKESTGSKSQKRGNCSKFYGQYGKNNLTGGIMGEGRNDAFSALYTCWKKAPKRVVYGFACALRPYCLIREPEFFLDTEFRIDTFHAKDHTKCAPATFLATYAAANPELISINTSLKIRKSVS